MKARISQLYKTEAEWAKLPDFVPMGGELIIFAPDARHSYARLKIGDGTTLLQKLPFFGSNGVTDNGNGSSDAVLDAGRITEYNKK